MRVAIIGAGLAGCALAYVLKNAGAEPVIYEAEREIAPGASGNALGLYNPRFTAEFGPEAQFYRAAFMQALATFPALEGIEWNPCGALHFVTDEKKDKRFSQCVKNWPAPEMRLVDAAEASTIAGVAVDYPCLYLPQSGSVSPKALCAAYAHGVEVHYNTYVPALDLVEADAVVLASGMGALGFYPFLPLKGVRGQITFAKANAVSRRLRCAIGYGGYVSPANGEGLHCAGSTFQRWLTHSDIRAEDDADNLAKLARYMPALAGLEIAGARAAVRTTATDHFPVIGQMEEGVYISAAHGSHGILSALMGAHIIAARLLGQTSPLSEAVINALSPHRFSRQEGV